jgi:hypothetical protein
LLPCALTLAFGFGCGGDDSASAGSETTLASVTSSASGSGGSGGGLTTGTGADSSSNSAMGEQGRICRETVRLAKAHALLANLLVAAVAVEASILVLGQSFNAVVELGGAARADYARLGAASMALPVLLCILVGLLMTMFVFVGHRTIEVGIDGVLICSRLRRRFVPYSSATRIMAVGRSVVIRERSGWTARLPLGESTEAKSLAMHLECLRRIAEAAVPRYADNPLDRASRPLQAWFAALRGMMQKPRCYRRRKTELDDLAWLAMDAHAPLERRIGAAAAMSACNDPEFVANMRDNLRLLADERARRALMAALEGDFDGIGGRVVP